MTQKDDVGRLDFWTNLCHPSYLDRFAKFVPFLVTWTTLQLADPTKHSKFCKQLFLGHHVYRIYKFTAMITHADISLPDYACWLLACLVSNDVNFGVGLCGLVLGTQRLIVSARASIRSPLVESAPQCPYVSPHEYPPISMPRPPYYGRILVMHC